MNRQCCVIIGLFLLAVIMPLQGHAGKARHWSNTEVKLDDSGRPLYNSWERYDYERQQRQKRQKNMKAQPATKSTPAPTPSSVIVNRPIQTKGDQKAEDFSF